MESFPFFHELKDFINSEEKSFILNFIRVDIKNIFEEDFKKVQNDPTVVFVLSTGNLHGMVEQRRIFFEFISRKIINPVIIKRDYENISDENFRLNISTDIGALLIDGFGDGVWVTGKDPNKNNFEKNFINRTLFGILQACRTRISKTEFIACPSCGRTLFNLVEVTNQIRQRTGHLKGVKIAIMGCIVNGPGEMADADYGYVGAGPGKITLYRGKEIVKRNIFSEKALDELIGLIKEDGRWIDAQNSLTF